MPGSGWGSRANWAACEICYGLIEAGKRTELTTRSAESFFDLHPEVPNTKTVRRNIFLEISALHAAFFIARTGEPMSTTGRFGIGKPK